MCREEDYIKSRGMGWAAFDTTTGRQYVVYSNVPNSIIDIWATLAPITNNNEDWYTFIEYYLFFDELAAPRHSETFLNKNSWIDVLRP